jgi:hypothetical protein
MNWGFDDLCRDFAIGPVGKKIRQRYHGFGIGNAFIPTKVVLNTSKDHIIVMILGN